MTTERGDQLDPTPSQVLEAVLDSAGQDLRVAIPGIVTKVERTDPPTVTVAPAIKRTGQAADPPVPGVRVAVMRSGGATVALPISVGDSVWLMVADRDLDGWLGVDGAREVEAADPRTHDLADCVAYPMDAGSLPSGAASSLWIGYAGNYIKQVTGSHTIEGTSILLGALASLEFVLKGTTVVTGLTTFFASWVSAITTYTNADKSDHTKLLAALTAYTGSVATAIGLLQTSMLTWKSAKVKVE